SPLFYRGRSSGEFDQICGARRPGPYRRPNPDGSEVPTHPHRRMGSRRKAGVLARNNATPVSVPDGATFIVLPYNSAVAADALETSRILHHRGRRPMLRG